MWHQSQIILKWQGFIPEQKRVPPSPSGALIVGLISQWGGLCAPNLRCRPLSCISCVAEIFKGWTHSVWFTLFVCSWRFCWTFYLILDLLLSTCWVNFKNNIQVLFINFVGSCKTWLNLQGFTCHCPLFFGHLCPSTSSMYLTLKRNTIYNFTKISPSILMFHSQ